MIVGRRSEEPLVGVHMHDRGVHRTAERVAAAFDHTDSWKPAEKVSILRRSGRLIMMAAIAPSRISSMSAMNFCLSCR